THRVSSSITSAVPHPSFSMGQGFSFGFPVGSTANSIITAVQQKEYSAGVWLRRREKLEHSQQKCIVIFALVCCFAVLMALIFSAVDIWGEDEDGITEENCSRNCRIVLVENIPEDISFLDNSTLHLPLLQGLNSLLDRAVRVVEVVSPLWNTIFTQLNSKLASLTNESKNKKITKHVLQSV
uniref:Uncharacterized protein n=1 Tax=Gouania willdenowi TaxID=441366 RepID=A0A8C5GWD3_GOUWI